MSDRELFPSHRLDVHPDFHWLGASAARFSTCLKRRYELTRRVSVTSRRIACLLMLNPSKAGSTENDNTVTRGIEFTRLWGCGWLVVVNLFPWISTDPLGLYLVPLQDVQAARSLNDQYILRCASAARTTGGLTVCAWGTHGHYLAEDLRVLQLLEREGIDAQCLGTTVEGYPRHPGRIAYSTRLDPYPTQAHLRSLAARSRR